MPLAVELASPMTSMKKLSSNPKITLGGGWRQFAFAQPDLEYLGVIQRGMEIGALARNADGQFMQINGDVRQLVNAGKVRAILKSMRPVKKLMSVTQPPTIEQRARVVVTIKPKRKLIEKPSSKV